MDKELANRISKICLEKFDGLPKTGKPNADYEWTILSAIVQKEEHESCPKLQVVSLGTGTKCLGSVQLSDKGDILNDSHAEVMARRGFLRYIMNEMKNSFAKRTSVLVFNESTKKFSLKKHVTFNFFTTHSPCGDASIYEKSDGASQQEPTAKKIKVDTDSFKTGIASNTTGGMTGGKLLQTSGNDLMAQDLGMIRTKPGKGVRTLSLSCSDKMSRWNVLGLQGSLLMMLLEEPIYLESIVICDGTDYCREAIERAIWKRWDPDLYQGLLEYPFKPNQPSIAVATNGKVFQFRKNRTINAENKFQPSPGGTVWCSCVEKELEVEISGRRQGVTKKKLGTPAARLKISKIELFSTFVALWKEVTVVEAGTKADSETVVVAGAKVASETSCYDAKMNLSSPGKHEGGAEAVADFSRLRYVDAKKLSRSYREQWNVLRTRVFRGWSEKPSSLLNFTLGSDGLP